MTHDDDDDDDDDDVRSPRGDVILACLFLLLFVVFPVSFSFFDTRREREMGEWEGGREGGRERERDAHGNTARHADTHQTRQTDRQTRVV